MTRISKSVDQTHVSLQVHFIQYANNVSKNNLAIISNFIIKLVYIHPPTGNVLQSHNLIRCIISYTTV